MPKKEGCIARQLPPPLKLLNNWQRSGNGTNSIAAKLSDNDGGRGYDWRTQWSTNAWPRRSRLLTACQKRITVKWFPQRREPRVSRTLWPRRFVGEGTKIPARFLANCPKSAGLNLQPAQASPRYKRLSSTFATTGSRSSVTCRKVMSHHVTSRFNRIRGVRSFLVLPQPLKILKVKFPLRVCSGKPQEIEQDIKISVLGCGGIKTHAAATATACRMRYWQTALPKIKKQVSNETPRRKNLDYP
jgi:hypothetical protein